jgi:hypothetical protein
MKFKVGDTVKYKAFEDSKTYKIVRIAEPGDLIEGPWSCGYEYQGIKFFWKAYILGDKKGFWCYDAVKNEEDLELVPEGNRGEELRQKLQEARETAKRARETANRLEEELIEFERNTFKFEVGDVLRYKGCQTIYKVVKIAEPGEVIKGNWGDKSKFKEFVGPEKSYILENKKGKWYCTPKSREGRLVLISKDELKRKSKEKLKSLSRELKIMVEKTEKKEDKLRRLEDLHENEEYYEVLYKGEEQ